VARWLITKESTCFLSLSFVNNHWLGIILIREEVNYCSIIVIISLNQVELKLHVSLIGRFQFGMQTFISNSLALLFVHWPEYPKSKFDWRLIKSLLLIYPHGQSVYRLKIPQPLQRDPNSCVSYGGLWKSAGRALVAGAFYRFGWTSYFASVGSQKLGRPGCMENRFGGGGGAGLLGS